MPRLVVLRALRRFTGPEGMIRKGQRFRTTEGRATRLEAAGFGERTAAESWPLAMKPEAYLERYPDGKHADLARRLT